MGAKLTEARCTICGEPMEEAESMFKFHGSLGPCPKPPLPKPKLDALVEYLHREADGKFWLDIHVNRQPYESISFNTTSERQRAQDDMLAMMRSIGAADLPGRPQ